MIHFREMAPVLVTHKRLDTFYKVCRNSSTSTLLTGYISSGNFLSYISSKGHTGKNDFLIICFKGIQ